MSADVFAGLFMIAASGAAVVAYAIRKRRKHRQQTDRRSLPGNLGDTWPQLDEWEADTEEAITQALRNIADDAENAIAFHTPKKDRIAAMIAANHVRRIDLDEDWKRYGGAR